MTRVVLAACLLLAGSMAAPLVLAAKDPSVLIIVYEWRNNSVCFMHNLSPEPSEVAVKADLIGKDAALLVNLLAENHSRADKRGRHHVVLESYGYRWYRVGGLDYILKRSEV